MWTAIIFALALFCSYVTLKSIVATFLISDEIAKKNKSRYEAHHNFIYWFSIISCALWGLILLYVSLTQVAFNLFQETQVLVSVM